MASDTDLDDIFGPPQPESEEDARYSYEYQLAAAREQGRREGLEQARDAVGAELDRLKAENARLREAVGDGEVLAAFAVEGCEVYGDELDKWLYCGDEPLLDDVVTEAERKALRDVEPQPVRVAVVVMRGGERGDQSDECGSCGEVDDEVCPNSRRPCGHHCNHSWSHDGCCWCGKEWGLDG